MRTAPLCGPDGSDKRRKAEGDGTCMDILPAAAAAVTGDLPERVGPHASRLPCASILNNFNKLHDPDQFENLQDVLLHMNQLQTPAAF